MNDHDATQDVVANICKYIAQGTRILGLSGCLEVPLILALMFKCTPQDLCKSLPFPAVSVRKYI
jgi:hypothetical protein